MEEKTSCRAARQQSRQSIRSLLRIADNKAASEAKSCFVKDVEASQRNGYIKRCLCFRLEMKLPGVTDTRGCRPLRSGQLVRRISSVVVGRRIESGCGLRCRCRRAERGIVGKISRNSNCGNDVRACRDDRPQP